MHVNLFQEVKNIASGELITLNFNVKISTSMTSVARVKLIITNSKVIS